MPKKQTTVRPSNKRRAKKHIKRRKNGVRDVKKEKYDKETARKIIDSMALPKLKTKVKKLSMLKLLDTRIKSLSDKYDPNLKRLSEENIKYVKKMMKKYGEDTHEMFRDIKLNNLQWSEGEIKRTIKIHEDNLEKQADMEQD
mmetsp:Transcript_27658/g.24489  ORF Transcript_27658/g.24489 Transcript_27658/m.24489 type:complete len:142 (+) Transcript_27658:29-454(+)